MGMKHGRRGNWTTMRALTEEEKALRLTDPKAYKIVKKARFKAWKENEREIRGLASNHRSYVLEQSQTEGTALNILLTGEGFRATKSEPLYNDNYVLLKYTGE